MHTLCLIRSHLEMFSKTKPGCSNQQPETRIIESTIWNPDHLDKTRRFRTSRYIPVCTGVYWYEVYIPTCTGIFQHIPNRDGIYLYIRYQRNYGFSIVGMLLSCQIMQVYTSHVQYNTSWCFKCKMIHV